MLNQESPGFSRGEEVNSYSEMVDVIEHLPFLVREKRRERRLSMRDVAKQTGLSGSTFTRLESGAAISFDGLIALLKWLDAPVEAGGPDA